MKKQSPPKQIVIGAFLGVLLTLIAQLKEPNPESLLSAGGIGLLFGGAVGGGSYTWSFTDFGPLRNEPKRRPRAL